MPVRYASPQSSALPATSADDTEAKLRMVRVAVEFLVAPDSARSGAPHELVAPVGVLA